MRGVQEPDDQGGKCVRVPDQNSLGRAPHVVPHRPEPPEEGGEQSSRLHVAPWGPAGLARGGCPVGGGTQRPQKHPGSLRLWGLRAGGPARRQVPLLGARGPLQDGSQDDVHLLVGAHVPLGPGDAAPAAAGGVVVGPAHHHLAVQVHGGEAPQEEEGAELEADDARRGLGVGAVGAVLGAPARGERPSAGGALGARCLRRTRGPTPTVENPAAAAAAS